MAAKYPNFSHECPMPSISRKNKSCASQSRACIQHKAIIHPQAFLQAERAIELNPDNKAATASCTTIHSVLLRRMTRVRVAGQNRIH